jgi:hypothetical protein
VQSQGYLTSYTETDPVWTADKPDYYTSIQVDNLPVSTFTNDVGYLTSYTETDPVWISDSATYSAKSWVQALPISTFTNDVPYLTSYTETDPIWISDSATYAAKSWVQSQGYLTSYTETDPFYFAAFDSLLRNEDTASLLATQYDVFTAVDTLTTDGITEGTTNLYNQTHTGDVTGATTLTIASNAVGADELNVSGNGTIGYSLTSDGDGSFSWTDVLGGAGTSYWTPSNDTLYPNSGYNHVYAADFVGVDTSEWTYTSLGIVPNVLTPKTSDPIYMSNQLYNGNQIFAASISGYSGSGITLDALELNPTSTEDVTVGYLLGVAFPQYKADFKVNGNHYSDTSFTKLSYDSLYNVPDVLIKSDTVVTAGFGVATWYDLFTAIDTLTYLREETDPVWSAEKSDYYTSAQVDANFDDYNAWRLWYSADNATGRNITSGGHVYVNDGYGVTVTSTTQSNATYTWADINVKADTSEIATQYDLTQVGGTSYWDEVDANGIDLTGNYYKVGINNDFGNFYTDGAYGGISVTSTDYYGFKTYGSISTTTETATTMTSGSSLGRIFFNGDDGTRNAGVYLEGVTTETWGTGAVGSGINLYTISNGNTSASLALKIDGSQNLIVNDAIGIGVSSVTSGYKLDVNGNTTTTSLTVNEVGRVAFDTGDTTKAYIQGYESVTGVETLLLYGDEHVQLSTNDLSMTLGIDDLEIDANIDMQKGVSHNVTVIPSSSYTILNTDYYIILHEDSTFNATLTLPTTGLVVGRTFIINNENSTNTIKVGTASDFRGLTDGVTITSSADGETPKGLELYYTGEYWLIRKFD